MENCKKELFGKPWVFVADDDDLVRRGIVKRLSRHNFHVRAFESGESLLHRLNQETPSVIVIDYKMPGLSGVQTLEKIREKNRFVPVIILTAYQGSIDIQSVQKLGVYEIVTKSVGLSDLAKVVHQAIKVHKEKEIVSFPLGNQRIP